MERPAEVEAGAEPGVDQLLWEIFDGAGFSDDGSRTMQRCEDIASRLIERYEIVRRRYPSSATLPTADDVLLRAIEGLRQIQGNRRVAPPALWLRVRMLAGYGSTTSKLLCVKYGFNPDEIWRP